jgi:NAD(P)-dependent dehydrogenase (short-subunit alcohol dehydrogenase family)
LSKRSSKDVSGRVVAVTGAGRGIGAATAKALVAAGAKVAIGDIDLSTAEATAERLGGGTLALRLDVSDPAGFDAFLDAVESQLGPIDVLVNNAGIMPLNPLLEEDDATTARVLEINVGAVIHGTREAVRRMLPRGGGHVVNIASTAGKAGVPGAATYCASKSAVIGFSEAVRLEFRDQGIEVTCVMPGITRTELTDGVADMPGFPSIQPEDVADAIVAAVAKPRFEVYVPTSAGPLLTATGLMPRRTREWVGRKMGVDHVFLDAAANPERKAYEERARGN